jgi:hypothetical protein
MKSAVKLQKMRIEWVNLLCKKDHTESDVWIGIGNDQCCADAALQEGELGNGFDLRGINRTSLQIPLIVSDEEVNTVAAEGGSSSPNRMSTIRIPNPSRWELYIYIEGKGSLSLKHYVE